MAAIDFPSSPTDGQLFTPGNSVTYRWQATPGIWVSSGWTSGKLLQMVSAQSAATQTITATIPLDNTVPQITEGAEVITCAITPKSATSQLLIEVETNLANSHTSGQGAIGAIFQDANANALRATFLSITGQNEITPFSMRHIMVAGTVSSTTIRFRVGAQIAPSTGLLVNMNSAGAAVFGGVWLTTITIQEIAP